VTRAALPDVAEILGPLLARVEPGRQPLMLAIAERMAAERYRAWAAEVTDPAARAQLLACAGREEEIAGRVEAVVPDAAAIERELRAAHPDLVDINRTVFAGRPLRDQFAIQAQGERLGAMTWRAFAAAGSAAARDAFQICATLEEASADVLEALIAAGAP
jgi:hypothetical protein